MLSLANIQPIDLEAVRPLLFYGFAACAAGSALWVVFSQNIVRMAVGLLLTLCSVAALYFLLEAEFLAAIQLIVYVGGTLILIIFGVMLTTKGPGITHAVPLAQRVTGWAIGLAAMIIMAVMGVVGVVGQSIDKADHGSFMGPTDIQENAVSLEQMGEALVSTYVIPLQVAAVLLLVVMIGAAYIAKGRQHEAADGGNQSLEGASH